MCERYGKKNVISAWVHMDETTPHIHFCFTPVVTNTDGTEKLCAKEVISRLELSKFHPELQKYVENKMKQEVAILNGATAGGNLTIAELKLRTALERLAEIEARIGSLETAQPIINEVTVSDLRKDGLKITDSKTGNHYLVTVDSEGNIVIGEM